MKIDAMSGYSVYRKNSGASPAKAAPSQTESANKTDVVEFSRGQTAAPNKDFLSLKSGIMSDISRSASPEKLAALKDSIREGSYRPSMDQLVDAILGK